ncbi:MAG: ornithine cyclodeaminase family protein [Dehalobacterium sp.]
MGKIDILFLNKSDIEKMDLSAEEVLDAVEKGLLAQGNNQTVIEPRVHLFPDPQYDPNDPNPDGKYHGHWNILRGYIEPLGVAGVKVIGDYVYNYEKELPSEMATLLLFDPGTGAPRAIIDATEITNMRTGALTALGAKYLARKQNNVLGQLGAGGTAWYNVVYLDSLYNFKEIRVSSRRPESREEFARRLSEYLGKPVKAVSTSEECLKGADIMVESTRLIEPQVLFKTEWVKPGNFVVPYGSVSCVELSLTDVMDKVVVDDVKQCFECKRYGSLRRHVDTGKISPDSIHGELGEIVAGKKPGRENDQERILFWHRGMSLSDIALGELVCLKAQKEGLGVTLNYI